MFLDTNTIHSIYRVQIIASHFRNCEVNSSYCNCKLVNHMKIVKQFFSQGKLICTNYIFPHYILISFIHCILLSKEILFVPKITPQNAKNALQFLNIFKKHFCLWQGKSLTTLSIFIAKWISSNNSNTDIYKKTLQDDFLTNEICWTVFKSILNATLSLK